MVTHTRNWSSAFNPSKCTHTAVSSEHAPGAVGSHCSSTRGAIGGSVPCSRAPQSWYWRWRECCSFTVPTFNPCRTWDSNPQPLDYKSDSLNIRPRLPHLYMHLRPIHTAQTNANKLQQTSLLEFVGSVCYPCWHWLEFGFTRLNMLNRCLLVQCKHDSYFS